MTNEEKKIKQLFGNENHFHVPEGYFDTLTDQILAKLPEEENFVPGKEGVGIDSEPVAQKVSLWSRLPIRKIAASVVVAAMLGGGLTYGLRKAGTHGGAFAHTEVAETAQIRHNHNQVSTATSDDAAFEQMADYAMMDNQDIYASLIAENQSLSKFESIKWTLTINLEDNDDTIGKKKNIFVACHRDGMCCERVCTAEKATWGL